LLHRQEIDKLIGKTQQKGLTLIPLRIYFRDGIAKCELALARGKKQWDRRQTEREKETRRELSEAMYKYRRRRRTMGPSMQINLDSRPASKVEAEALVSYVFEPEKEQGTIVQGVVADLDQAAGGALGRLAADGELTGKMLEFTLVHFAPGISAQRVVLVGAGKREKFGTAELRRLASAAVRYLKARSVKRIAFLARESERTAEAAQAVTEGLVLGNFDGDKYRTDKKNAPVESAALVGFDPAAQGGIGRGRIIAESQNFTRELGNEPSN